MWLIVLGFLVHIVLLASVFDIYFKSPIVHGITPYLCPLPAPAKRLVLFVADGLRADSFYHIDAEQSRAPYLRSVLETRGSWGVSHTRVPTESRPGHVALIAGFYEDPSAVARGWKENPVEFDSVFNESRFTWSWGSPDILPMFAKGASGNHVHTEMYDANDEDFSGAHSTTKLDTWVFDKVEAFLVNARSDPALAEKLASDKIVLFLHLLGLDTAGHTHKPHAAEYSENIRVVDAGIQKVERLIEEFYQFDNRTAYVFTADHGMTDWGSHGAGDPSETETPLLAWGAGLSGPRLPESPHSSPHSWKLHRFMRRDVEQADIAVLMASLVGVPIPVNSVGSLPVAYLNVTDTQLSEAMLANAWQMMAQYDKKRAATEFGTYSWLYRPFNNLTHSLGTEMLDQIRRAITSGNHKQVMTTSRDLIELSRAGFEYYQNYYQNLLLFCTSLTFLGWIGQLVFTLLPDNTCHLSLHHGGRVLNTGFVMLIACTGYLIHAQLLPAQFYVYCLLPAFLWWFLARQRANFLVAISDVRSSLGAQQLFLHSLLYLAGIEIIVASFFHRSVLSAGVLGLAAWPLMSARTRSVHRSALLAWLFSSTLLAIFPLLPVVSRDANVTIVAASGWLWLLVALSFMLLRNDERARHTTLAQLVLLLLAMWNLYQTAASFNNKLGLPLTNQIISWTLLGSSFVLAVSAPSSMLTRLGSVSLSLGTPFLLLSVSHEGFFLLALIVNIFCWLIIEHHCSDTNRELSNFSFQLQSDEHVARSLSSQDFRRAFFFLFYIILSFFGTGNIASVNSFDPAWVRSFLSVFSPFLMTALILWKTLVPFVLVTCVFRAINIVVKAPVNQLFLIAMVFCDTLGLHFLYLVTNRGSWLDIGTSISHYVIVQAIVLFLALLYALARALTDVALWREEQRFYSLEAGDKRHCE